MHVVKQASIRPHVLQLPDLALAARFRPLAAKILAATGVVATASSREKARAIVGWFAANAVHPQPFLHPDGTTLNTSVLPVGETWASYNTIFGADARSNSDNTYWYGIFPDGIAMVQRLIGDVASNGNTTDNGMLTEYAPSKWRIRNFADFRSVQCTHQSKMAQVLLASIGIQSFDISTNGHDPMCFYENETGRWLYIDPTFGEMQYSAGQNLNPLDLVSISLAGNKSQIIGEKLPGASYIPVSYFTSPSTPDEGMDFMTVHTSPNWAGGSQIRAPYRFGSLPSQSATFDKPASADQIMPDLGCGAASVATKGPITEIRLRTNWPNAIQFQRSTDSGATWTNCTSIDYVQGLDASYRSIDANNFYGLNTVINL